MKRFALILAGLAGLFVIPSIALCDLCGQCQGKMYIMSVGKCQECGGHASSGAHKLCKACSKKLGECEHCRAKLGGEKKAGQADKPAKPGDSLRGKVKDDKLKKLAPESGFVADAKTLTKLLKVWGAEDPNWTTDFEKNLVLVATADGPNAVFIGTKEENGNVKVVAGSTLMAGPGFGWAMKVVSREGVKSVNSNPLPAGDGDGGPSYRKLDFSEKGSAVHGLWAYRWTPLKGKKGRIGELLYAGKPIPVLEEGRRTAWQNTPWGTATHSNVMKDTGGWHGWLFAEPASEQPSILPVPVMLTMGKDFNPYRTATHKSGDWTYEYEIKHRSSKSETRIGTLSFDGNEVEGENRQWMITPWGVMQKFDKGYHRGWLSAEAMGRPLVLYHGKQLISPLAKRRVEALKRDLNNLSFGVTYRGPDAGKKGCPLSALLHTDDAVRSVLYGTQLLKIDAPIASGLIDAMACDGVLDFAMDANRANIKWPKGPCYMIGVKQTGSGAKASYVWDAGWNLTTLDHIRNLAQAAGYNEASQILQKVVQSVPDQQDKKWTRKATRDTKMKLTSPAFEDGKDIPQEFTGEGKDVSPALKWEGLPDGTKELALICQDPDAPREDPWVHWVIYNIPAERQGLPEGLPRKETLQEDMYQGTNSWDENNLGYRGPMPPEGHGAHRYIFTLYALDADVDIEPGKTVQDLRKAMQGHVLAEAELMGTYERK